MTARKLELLMSATSVASAMQVLPEGMTRQHLIDYKRAEWQHWPEGVNREDVLLVLAHRDCPHVFFLVQNGDRWPCQIARWA